MLRFSLKIKRFVLSVLCIFHQKPIQHMSSYSCSMLNILPGCVVKFTGTYGYWFNFK